MRTHARYEQNGQPPRKAMKVKAEKIKAENKIDEPTKLIGQNNNNNMNNNNDISMFNQNSLENINELRMKLQENLLANSGIIPSELSNLKREIKIEFWNWLPTSAEWVDEKWDTIIYDIFLTQYGHVGRLVIKISFKTKRLLKTSFPFDIERKIEFFMIFHDFSFLVRDVLLLYCLCVSFSFLFIWV